MSAVVGLDLSLTATGIATPEGVRTITSRGRKGDNLWSRRDRLSRLAGQIGAAITDESPFGGALVVIEGPSIQRAAGGTHDRSGLWWLVVDELFTHQHTIVEVAPSARAKYATGKGNAGKDEVLAAVVRRYPDVLVTNNNEADSLVLRAMGCDWLGEPLATVPQTHRVALDKVAWPDAARRSA